MVLHSIFVHYNESILNSFFQFVLQDANGNQLRVDNWKQHFLGPVEGICCLKIALAFVFVLQLLLFVFEQIAFVPADVVVWYAGLGLFYC